MKSLGNATFNSGDDTAMARNEAVPQPHVRAQGQHGASGARRGARRRGVGAYVRGVKVRTYLLFLFLPCFQVIQNQHFGTCCWFPKIHTYFCQPY